MAGVQWTSPHSIAVQRFRCSYCGDLVASEKGLQGSYGGANPAAFVGICPNCTFPTFLRRSGEQVPSPRLGNDVEGITERSILDLYNEARNCTAAQAHTAAVLCCRKILMHIAVAKGARVGDTFVAYVDYLASKNYIPPDGRDWVDHIRKSGNDANHEIMIASRDLAEELLGFTEMLLKFVYEFPYRVRLKAPSPP